MRVLLVHHRQVIEDVLAVLVHPADAVLDDHRDLVRECRIVRQQIRHRERQHVAVAVLMLQSLARERRAPRRAAEEKAARAHVRRRPDEIRHPLESEHRVVNEKRNRVHAVRRVRRARGDERRNRPRLRDPFLENLAVLRFVVVEQHVAIDRLVLLPHARIDSHRAEERFHAERPRFVRHDRHDQVADFRILQHLAQHPHERHRRRNVAPAAALQKLLEQLVVVRSDRLRAHVPLRNVAAQRRAPFSQIANLLAVLRRTIEGHVHAFFIVQRNTEARTENPQLLLVHLLLLVRDVLALRPLRRVRSP